MKAHRRLNECYLSSMNSILYTVYDIIYSDFLWPILRYTVYTLQCLENSKPVIYSKHRPRRTWILMWPISVCEIALGESGGPWQLHYLTTKRTDVFVLRTSMSRPSQLVHFLQTPNRTTYLETCLRIQVTKTTAASLAGLISTAK